MSLRNGLFSSESVSEGHPDTLADRNSDRVPDAFLVRDPHARVASYAPNASNSRSGIAVNAAFCAMNRAQWGNAASLGVRASGETS